MKKGTCWSNGRVLFKRIPMELRQINLRCICIGAGIILFGGILSVCLGGSPAVYRLLLLPKCAPPPFLFPIIWTILYLLLGGAVGAVFCNCEKYKENDKYKGILFFVLMMVFNILWYPLFFKAQCFFLALLAALIILTLSFFAMLFFVRVYFVAGIAMAIYIVWLVFAVYLNFTVVLLN